MDVSQCTTLLFSKSIRNSIWFGIFRTPSKILSYCINFLRQMLKVFQAENCLFLESFDLNIKVVHLDYYVPRTLIATLDRMDSLHQLKRSQLSHGSTSQWPKTLAWLGEKNRRMKMILLFRGNDTQGQDSNQTSSLKSFS